MSSRRPQQLPHCVVGGWRHHYAAKETDCKLWPEKTKVGLRRLKLKVLIENPRGNVQPETELEVRGEPEKSCRRSADRWSPCRPPLRQRRSSSRRHSGGSDESEDRGRGTRPRETCEHSFQREEGGQRWNDETTGTFLKEEGIKAIKTRKNLPYCCGSLQSR